MHAIKGNYRQGKIVLTEKADWPENTEVLVAPVPVEPMCGMRDEDWPTTPEGIEEWIKWYDSLEPFLTPEEEANWHAALREQAEFDKAHFEENARRLEKLWE
jgi:hypothetical protein